MGTFAWAIHSVRRRGLVQTMKVAASVVADLSFDWRHGTNTMRWVEVNDLGAAGEHRLESERYQATKARALWTLLNSLELPRESGFVDFGSGKGRVLLIAALYGFRKIVGVEFSPHLCEYSRRNVEIFKRRSRVTARIQVVLLDAAHYPIQPDQHVFFMYNPFGEAVMARVVVNLRRSVETAPRQIWLIYNTPNYQEVIDRTGIFPSCSRQDIGGTEFLVYTNIQAKALGSPPTEVPGLGRSTPSI